MNKWSILKDMIHGADVIIEVVDARDVEGTRLPIAERWAGSKRLMMIANKKDLLPKGAVLPKLENKGIMTSAKQADEDERWRVIRAIMDRTEKRPIKAILVGYPNVGKSSLINLLSRRKAARVSPVAGTTTNIQWVNITPELTISDYRGIFPGKETKEDLVRKGALNIQEDPVAYAQTLTERALKDGRLMSWLETEFDIDLKSAKTTEDILASIGRRRGWLLKGGEPNMDEAAKGLLRAFMRSPFIK